MKLAAILITIAIVQLLVGGFYGFFAPTRIEQNIQTDLARARDAASERLKIELSPAFASKYPQDFDMRLEYEMKEALSLAQSARRGWSSLELTSWILIVSGLLTLAAGVAARKSDPGEVVNASQTAGLSESHLHD